MKKIFSLIIALFAVFFAITATPASANEADDLAIEYYNMHIELSTTYTGFNDIFFQENPEYKESVYETRRNVYLHGRSIQYLFLKLFRRGEKLVNAQR